MQVIAGFAILTIISLTSTSGNAEEIELGSPQVPNRVDDFDLPKSQPGEYTELQLQGLMNFEKISEKFHSFEVTEDIRMNYTLQEIEGHRWITHWMNGTVTTASDEEVIKMMEYKKEVEKYI